MSEKLGKVPPASSPSSVVVDLDGRRLQEMERSIRKTRARLEKLQRKRFRAEIKAGRLQGKLARLNRERKAFLEHIERHKPPRIA